MVCQTVPRPRERIGQAAGLADEAQGTTVGSAFAVRQCRRRGHFNAIPLGEGVIKVLCNAVALHRYQGAYMAESQGQSPESPFRTVGARTDREAPRPLRRLASPGATGGVLHPADGLRRIPLGSPESEAEYRPVSPASSPLIEEARAKSAELGASLESRPAGRYEITLSIVIPAYNEEARLIRTVLEVIRWCTTTSLNFELIIVDDGSRDQTLVLSRIFEENDSRVHVLACPHAGKGAAVRMGMLNAKGRMILFMDADGATPLDEIVKLSAAIGQGHDVAIGSRAMEQYGEVTVRTPLHRRLIGRTFAFLVSLFAFRGIADTQCGFKMFRRDAATAVFSRQKITSFAFDVEVLYIARRLSLSITEIPVNWIAQGGSKVNLVTDSIRMLWDTVRIRWLHRHFKATPLLKQARQPRDLAPQGN